MNRITRALATLALLLTALPAQARDSRGGAAGDFDFYLLALSVAPSFCALSQANQAKPECQALTRQDFQRTPLTVHGLWPNRTGVSVNRQPQECAGPPLDRLSTPIQDAMHRYMPAGPGLARYEWRKHGTCSGLSPEAYFGTEMRLAQHADETIGAVLRDQGMLGHTVRIADLLAAVAVKDRALAQAIVVDCRAPRGGGDPLIEEIRIVLTKDFAPLPAQTVGFGQNSGCRQGAGMLPDVPR